MKTKVQHDRDDARADGQVKLTIETAEDCQVAQDRYDALKDSAKGESDAEEMKALKSALADWHASTISNRR